MSENSPNKLFYGDNLDVLWRHVADESVDLVYLDPPFNSNANYNVLFAERDWTQAAAQIKAFEDTWRWDEGAARAYADVVEAGGRGGVEANTVKPLSKNPGAVQQCALGSRQTPPCRSPARAPLDWPPCAPPVATRGETCRARRAPTACRAGPRVASPVSAIRDPATARSTCRHRSPETARPVPRPRPARLKVSPHEIGQGRIVRSRLVCAQRPIYFLACRHHPSWIAARSSASFAAQSATSPHAPASRTMQRRPVASSARRNRRAARLPAPTPWHARLL